LTALVAGVVLFFFNPLSASIYPPCPFHHLTGLHCPGCGSLRATHQLLHGHLAAAFALNPLWVVLIPILVVISIPRFRPKGPLVPWLFFAVIVLFGILRNLPWWPFTLLAPHGM